MQALGQKAQLVIADRCLEYPELAYEFEINFSTDSDSNTGNLKIYNLSSATIDLFQKGQLFMLSAGYREDLGVILLGVIVSATSAWEGTEKITTAIIGDCTDRWLKVTINNTWRAGITASQVAKDIVANLGLGTEGIQIPKDITYPRGKTFSCTCKRALEELARDLKLKLHFTGGKLYLKPEEAGLSDIVLLNSDTGLMGSPEKVDDGQEKSKNRYKVQSLLNHRLRTDAVVKIESQSLQGLWRIDKGKHVLSGDDFHTEMEVVKYE
ncbi:MAG TPA: hypothetical protein VHY08_11665 [Bacillota bacterium]|nr:hypothetical protein [Bacillota bacterium]